MTNLLNTIQEYLALGAVILLVILLWYFAIRFFYRQMKDNYRLRKEAKKEYKEKVENGDAMEKEYSIFYKIVFCGVVFGGIILYSYIDTNDLRSEVRGYILRFIGGAVGLFIIWAIHLIYGRKGILNVLGIGIILVFIGYPLLTSFIDEAGLGFTVVTIVLLGILYQLYKMNNKK